MANPSLPSFVELMASLGLQDEHAANALLRGANDPSTPLPATGNNTPYPMVNTPDHINPFRHSNASLDTPLSSASLVTPLSSPPVQRERPTSHGKKRYSPYGLAALSGDPRDIYTRRGSVPDILSQAQYGQDRRLHHLSAPEPYHDHSSNSGRATDEDGDEEMEDASARLPPLHNYKQTTPSSSSLHCAGQPNLLISRQRIPRSGHGQAGMPRTKSHSHMRTTSIGALQRYTQQQQQQQQQQQRPPMPSPRMDMPMDTERSNVNDEGDIAVVSISSLLRRSHPQPRPVAASPNANAPGSGAATAAAATPTTGPTPTVSLDSPRGFQFPPVLPTSSAASASTSSLSESLRAPQQPHRAPPSAPPTKTSFGFLPGASLSGNISSSSISAVRRARHARSSSARSVREMIRERESNVLLAPLHSFHPMGETEEERENVKDSLKPSESRIRHRSTGQESVHSTTTDDRGATPPAQTSVPAALQAGSHSSFLPLDDSSRSFSHRRRVKRHTADATTTRTGGKKSSPPPPLMLPTLPISFNIRALVGGEREDKDRLAATDAGYVSRRDPHSPDPRGSWRRRVAPLEVAGGV